MSGVMKHKAPKRVGAASPDWSPGQASPRSVPSRSTSSSQAWRSLLQRSSEAALQLVAHGVLLYLLLIASALAAQVPPLQARVTDLTGTLSAREQANIEQELGAFEHDTGSQIAVLVVPTTQPETIEQYSIRVVDRWQLGREDVDDGALLLVAKGDRTMRIEVGYGLEGALNDATAKRIIAEIITPHFQRKDFYGGIKAGVRAMMKVIEGEPLPAPAREPTPSVEGDGLISSLPAVVFFAFVIGQFFRGIIGSMPAALGTAAVSFGIVWLLLGSLIGALLSGLAVFLILLLTGMSGGHGPRRGGYYIGGLGVPATGGIGGGSFGGGSFGGGGFSGGGGGFGGGGASGSW
jgi:uncharacterized protein